MGGRLVAAGGRRVASLPLLALWVLVVPCLFAQQYDLGQARKMLQQLEEDRFEAAKSAKGAGFTFGYIDRRLTAIGAVVNRSLGLALGSRIRPSCSALQGDLRRALGYRGEPDPRVASVLCRREGGAVYYIVVYALSGAVAYSRSWIGVFGPSPPGHGYELLASVDNSFPSKTVALAGLPQGGGGALNFVAYGINWGDALNRLTVIAYSLVGHTLRVLWSRSDLPEGQVKVEDGKITLNFLSAALGPGHKGVHWITQTYRLTPTGIRPESSYSRPRGSGEDREARDRSK